MARVKFVAMGPKRCYAVRRLEQLFDLARLHPQLSPKRVAQPFVVYIIVLRQKECLGKLKA